MLEVDLCPSCTQTLGHIHNTEREGGGKGGTERQSRQTKRQRQCVETAFTCVVEEPVLSKQIPLEACHFKSGHKEGVC